MTFTDVRFFIRKPHLQALKRVNVTLLHDIHYIQSVTQIQPFENNSRQRITHQAVNDFTKKTLLT